MNRTGKIVVGVWLTAAFLLGFFYHDRMHPSNKGGSIGTTLAGLMVGLFFLYLMWTMRKRSK